MPPLLSGTSCGALPLTLGFRHLLGFMTLTMLYSLLLMIVFRATIKSFSCASARHLPEWTCFFLQVS